MINVHIGIKDPSCGYQNCYTSQMLIFGGHLKVRQSENAKSASCKHEWYKKSWYQKLVQPWFKHKGGITWWLRWTFLSRQSPLPYKASVHVFWFWTCERLKICMYNPNSTKIPSVLRGANFCNKPAEVAIDFLKWFWEDSASAFTRLKPIIKAQGKG